MYSQRFVERDRLKTMEVVPPPNRTGTLARTGFWIQRVYQFRQRGNAYSQDTNLIAYRITGKHHCLS